MSKEQPKNNGLNEAQEVARAAAESWNNTKASTEYLLQVLSNLEHIELEMRKQHEAILEEEEYIPKAHTLLNHAIHTYANRLKKASSTKDMASVEEIRFQQLPYTLVLPETQPMPVGTGESEWKEPQTENRVATLVAHLGGIGIHRSDITLHSETLSDDMMRKTPYVFIHIPHLNKGILVCDQVGEATFVIDGPYRPMSKTQIQEEAGIRIVKFDEEQWIETILSLVQSNAPLEPQAQPTMDMKSKDYFTPQNVAFDLQAWAQSNNSLHIEEITASNIWSCTRFNATNNEKVTGGTYLSRASIAFGFAKNRREAMGNLADILNKLKEAVGIPCELPMDESYFRNPTNVREDLISWSIASSTEDIIAITTSTNFSLSSFIAMNGAELTGQTYVCRAGVELGFAENARAANSKRSTILKKIKEIAGIEKEPEIRPMDESYFRNPTNVREDLISISITAEQHNEGIGKINTGTCRRQSPFTALNGETVTLQTYICRAGVGLGFVKSFKQSSGNQKNILKKLQEIAGVVKEPEIRPMDESYFRNPTNVREDLISWSIASGAEDMMAITTSPQFKKQEFKTNNGEVIKGGTYTCRAGLALQMAQKAKDATLKGPAILKKLKEIAGVEKEPEIRPMDESYFRNPTNVRKDLISWSIASGAEDMMAIRTTGRFKKKEFKTNNGVTIKGGTYVNTAGLALGFGEKTRETNKCHKAIIEKLIEIAESAAEEK